MSHKQDFDKLVDLAMSNPALSSMRQVVEKELLHYEVFQALDGEGLLKGLVFQGGTALRLCRGSDRYSEDLDFAGGIDFSAEKMAKIGDYGVEGYDTMLDLAIEQIPAIVQGKAFKAQMSRFIDKATLARTLDQPGHLDYLSASVGKLFVDTRSALGIATPGAAPPKATPRSKPARTRMNG